MSVKIRISYETESELQEVIQRLQQPGMKVKRAEQKGQFKRTYVQLPGNGIDKTKNFRYNGVEQTFV